MPPTRLSRRGHRICHGHKPGRIARTPGLWKRGVVDEVRADSARVPPVPQHSSYGEVQMATARKLTTLTAIALAALGCTVGAGTSAHASAAATLDGYPCYSIASYYATRYTGDGSTPEDIDLAGPSTASGSAIHLWSYYYNARYGSASTGGGSQLWCLQPIATGEYRLISAYTAMQTG